MSGGLEESKQFIGISVREPYSDKYGSVLQRYSNTESGISEAHGHADQLAERMRIPREAIRVARYGANTELVDPAVAKPAPKRTAKTAARKVPSLNEAVVTRGGKSTTVKLGK